MDNQFVFFWHEYEENGFMSQWYKADFEVDGVKYNCCEQYMMAKKALAMGDVEYYSMIMNEDDPAIIKKLGKSVRNFNSDKWNAIVQKIIYDAKFCKVQSKQRISK